MLFFLIVAGTVKIVHRLMHANKEQYTTTMMILSRSCTRSTTSWPSQRCTVDEAKRTPQNMCTPVSFQLTCCEKGVAW